MADILPPIPYDKPQTSFEWIDWYTKLIDLINSGTQHNQLPGLQGGTAGEYYHLTSAEYASLGDVADGDKGDITVSGSGTVWTLDLRLDEIDTPTASVDFNQQQGLSFCVENRTSDPVSPAVGQLWIRTDL